MPWIGELGTLFSWSSQVECACETWSPVFTSVCYLFLVNMIPFDKFLVEVAISILQMFSRFIFAWIMNILVLACCLSLWSSTELPSLTVSLSPIRFPSILVQLPLFYSLESLLFEFIIIFLPPAPVLGYLFIIDVAIY